MSITARVRQLPGLVQAILVGAVLSRLAFSMTTPFLTIYLIRTTHLNLAVVGFVVGAASVAGMLGGFIAGALTDRFGRSKILIAVLYVWVIVFLSFAAAHSSWLLILLTLLNGACRSIFEPVSQVLMSDLTPEGQRYSIFSLRYTAANIGYSLGPIMGAWLGLTGGTGAFLFAGLTFLVYAVMLHLMLSRNSAPVSAATGVRPPASLASVAKVVLSDRALIYFLIGGMMARAAYEQVNSNLSVHFQQHVSQGMQLFAITVSLNAIVVVLLQLPISKWAAGKSLLTSVFAGNVCYAIGLAAMAFARSWTIGILAIFIFTLGEILSFPAGTLLIDKIAPEHLRGAYYGTKSILDLGKFFGPWLGGLVMSAWGGTPMLNLMAVIALLSTIFYRIGLKQIPVQTSTTQGNDAVSSL